MIAEPEQGRKLSDSEILSYAQRIAKSRAFIGSPRLCRFLTWTVQQTLENGGGDIKQYVIGQEVFDRGDKFDPRVDSIVRTEAQRLRRKLREYYASEGRSDDVQISFPPGSYVPLFSNRRTAGATCGQSTAAHSNDRPALAVLQFENLTGNPDLDYFCRGVTESIQERLAGVRGLKVVATTSSFSVSAREDLAVTASRLGVNTIVQGDIAQAKERVRVHARALNSGDGAYVWAGSFDRDLEDLFAVEDEIASSIGNSLSQQILGRPKPTSAPPSVEAYDLYLHGQDLCSRLTPEAYNKAVDCFTRAILVCPHYAQAYAALAEVYFWQVAFSQRAPRDLVYAARHAAQRAVQLDQECAEAYVVLGSLTSLFDWNWPEAERLFHDGLELRRNYTHAYIQRAFARGQIGDSESCRSDTEIAAELDPLSPRPCRAAALYSYLRRDSDAAIAAVERAFKLGSDLSRTLYIGGRVFLHAGQPDKAVELLLSSLDASSPALYRGVLTAAYAAAGRNQEARDTLQALHEQAQSSFISPAAFVYAYAGVGHVDEALNWLEKAADERYTGMMFLKWDPSFDNLRDEPRFQAVLRRMNIT